jgi:hypothetical protein
LRGSINQEVEGSVAGLALAVPVQPTNFLPLEISPDELMGASPQSDQVEQNEDMQQQQPIVQMEAVIQTPEPEHGNASDPLPEAEPHPAQSASVDLPQARAASPEQNLQQDQQSDNIQVGMFLLPDNLDIDPGLEEFINGHSTSQWKLHDSAEGTRLRAKHFASLGSSKGIEVPRSRKDFFTNVPLHP